MNWKCIIFGLFDHNWEEVENVKKEFVINNFLEDKFRKYALREIKRYNTNGIPPDHLDGKLKQYVCLRCCTVKDEISEFLNNCRKMGREEIEKDRRKARRKERAEAMLENCAKGKFKKIFK